MREEYEQSKKFIAMAMVESYRWSVWVVGGEWMMSGGRYGESEKWEMGESKKIGKKVRDLNKENGVGSRAIKKRLMEKRKD